MNCDVCGKTFTGIENYKQHEASKKHKNKMMIYLQNNGTPSNCISTISQETSEPLVGNKNTFPCLICSKNFYSMSYFMQHCNSEEHANMILNKKSETFMAEPVCSSSTDELSICDSQMNCHDSDSQLKKTSGLLNQPGSATPYYAKCEPCDKYFSGLHNYKEHLVSEKHKKKCGLLPFCVSQKKDPNIIAKECLSFDECDMTFNNSSSSQQCEEKISSMKPMLAESSSAKINSNNNSSFLMNNLICGICNMTFTGPIPHNAHLQSKLHKKNIERQQLLNQLVAGKENVQTNAALGSKQNGMSLSSPWYCEVCNKVCSGPEPYREHISSEKHNKNVTRAGAECKRSEIRNFMSQPSGEVDILSSQRSENPNLSLMGDNKTGCAIMPEKEVKDSGGLVLTIPDKVDEAVLNMTFFKVGEEIDFDKKEESCINITELEVDYMEEDGDEEVAYDDMPSP